MIPMIAGIGAALSTFLLLVLIGKRPKRRPDLWLAVWLTAQSIFFGGILLSQQVDPGLALIFLITGQIALFALGPAQYLYAASALGVRPRYLLHALAVAAAAGALIILMVSLRFEAESGTLVAEATSAWLVLTPVAATALAAIYPIAVLRLVAHRRESLKDRFSTRNEADPDWLRVWAFAMLAVLGSLAVAAVGRAMADWSTEGYAIVGLSVQVLSIIYVGQRGLTLSGVFSVPETPGREPSRVEALDLDLAAEDYARVQALFAEERPHLRIGLNAQTIADRLGWAPERLTQALRHGGGTNFFDAVNSARVREVIAMLARPANDRVSLLTLAHEAGFGSKSAFYEAFQRHAGCTPAAWRRTQARAPATAEKQD